MRLIVDLHIHSRFARACSKNLTLPNLVAWGRAKGIDVLATSDFTHPAWFAEISEKLEPAEPGLFRLRAQYAAEDGEGNYERAPAPPQGRDVRFVLSTEVSCIYKKDGKTRRIHLLVFMPRLEAVRAFNAALVAAGCNIRADGRPILGLDSREIVKIALSCDPSSMVVPAHAWTPWFSLFGSNSGFDSIEECFEEFVPHIKVIETGLSSDPLMNRRLTKLDGIALISNSDAHSLRNLGREANVIDVGALSYDAIMAAIREGDKRSFLYTIEFFPEEGMYHVDGHRACNFSCMPAETARLGNTCPKCGKPLTRGVLGRVDVLADRPEDAGLPAGVVPYRSIVPLEELIADAMGKGKATKGVKAAYDRLIAGVGPEFGILLDAEESAIAASSDAHIAAAVMAMRRGDVDIRPGYDGVYGEVHVRTAPPPQQSQLRV
jgi:DNA helicase-2/ATP-dependent DNA helicase PcrA